MKKITLLFASAVLLISFTNIANAHSKKYCYKKNFEKSDTNGDGVITKDEMIDFATKRAKMNFEEADLNNDGKITAEEHKSAKEKSKEKRKEKKKENYDNY